MAGNKKYDLIVAGGGLSGVAAAVAAAREGVKVLLIEKNGYLGGMATAGLVNPFMPYCERSENGGYNWSKIVNEGLFKEILRRLDQLEGLHKNRQTFNEEIMKLVLDRMILEHKIDILLHSFISSVEKQGARLKAVTVTSKSGTASYEGSYFVDATGDADLSTLAGCEYRIGRDSDHLCQPMTLCFRLANVDTSKYDRNFVNKKFNEMKQKGLIKNPREDVLTFAHVVDDVMHFNSTRVVGKSGVKAEDLTQAEIEAREQVYELYRFMKDNIPGFENCQLLMSAPEIGVRESRRIVGEYTITQEDLLNTVKFEDSIARGTYPVDIHNPSGSGTVIQHIPAGDYYTIPYRALLPKGMDNLIVAGRPISSTHEAHSAYRVMPICTCIGEGAGTAASIAVKRNLAFRDVDYKEIQSLLDSHGALY